MALGEVDDWENSVLMNELEVSSFFVFQKKKEHEKTSIHLLIRKDPQRIDQRCLACKRCCQLFPEILLNVVLIKYYQKKGISEEKKKQLNEWMFFLDW